MGTFMFMTVRDTYSCVEVKVLIIFYGLLSYTITERYRPQSPAGFADLQCSLFVDLRTNTSLLCEGTDHRAML